MHYVGHVISSDENGVFMNYRLILKLIGNMLLIKAAFLVFPLLVSFVYGGDDKVAFILTIFILIVPGAILSIVKSENKKFKIKDAFAATTISWILFSLFGALPFYFSGYFPSFVDCLFESVSGFATTGATILSNIEALPKGILFWRNFSHWIGGMGVLVFMLAVLPSMNASSINLLRAETTGLSPDRFVPKLRETARVMYTIYLSLTVLLIVLLLISGLPFYDALLHAFSTAGTGGFSNMNASVGAYGNVGAELIITIFMFLFGINFLLYFYLIKGSFKNVVNDEELRLYALIVLVAIGIITINLSRYYGTLLMAFRRSAFHVVSIITTTGFSTSDYNLWPVLSRVVLLLLMLSGCSAGSTGGGIKLVRFLILFKASAIELKKMVYPKSVKAVTLNEKGIDNDIITKTAVFVFIYFFIFLISSVIVSSEGKDIFSTLTAVIASLSNIGPGLGIVGPTGNYSEFSSLSKLVLSFCMLVGRLEIFPVLVLLYPSVWKKT